MRERAWARHRAGWVIAVWLSAIVAPPAAGAQAVGFGAMGGLIRTEVNSSGDESQNVVLEHQSHPTGGLFLTVPLSGPFWLQPEAWLNVKGTQWNTAELEGSLRLTYLDVPALVRYAGPSDAQVRVHVFGGPTLGFLLRARSEVERPVLTTIDVKDRFRVVDLGWVVGAGIGGGPFRLDLRYGGSFRAITEEAQLGGGAPPPTAGADPTFRNRAFQLVAGVRFF
jgi:hypothetical protein